MTAAFSPKTKRQSFTTSIQRKWLVKNLKILIALKTFVVKRKGVRDDVLT